MLIVIGSNINKLPKHTAHASSLNGGSGSRALLADPPGSRNAPRLTPGAKGKWYTPEKYDKRPSGARKRHYHGQYNREKGSSTMRNLMPGAQELLGLAKGVTEGIYENDQSTYKVRETLEEEKLFSVHDSVRLLIEGLENKQPKVVETVDEEAT